jgi:cardiolipin synthase A/B
MPTIAVPAWLLVLLSVISTWLVTFILLGSRRRNPPLHLERMPDVRSILPSVAGLTRGSICEGNTVEILQNGDAFFPAILRDIRSARSSIHLETYVWSKGEIARQVADALIKKVAEGVEVRLLVDALGAQDRERELFTGMKDAGVKIAVYCPLRLSNIARWNNRTHRKILVVDGRVGHVFGHGIADQWTGDGQDASHWRDTSVRVQGPVVHALQSVFAENWVEETLEGPSATNTFRRSRMRAPPRPTWCRAVRVRQYRRSR